MIKFYIKATLSLLIMLYTSAIYGQEYKIKFGDIPMDDMTMTAYPQDTSADAVILGDFGEVKFEYVQVEGEFKVVYTRYTRIKIFNKNGYNWADHKISLYDHGSLEEKVATFKGATYNLVNGKIEKSKVARKDLLNEVESEYWKSESFTMPDIQDNCIIEYEYTIKSNYIRNLPEWYFQRTIPVRWSELNIEIPEYFVYKPIMTGYEPLLVRDISYGRGKIVLTINNRDITSGDTRNNLSNQTIDFATTKQRLVAAEVPAFISEPMLTSSQNYISKVTFELESTKYPGQSIHYYTESWEAINKTLLESDRFGGQLDGGLFLNDIAKAIIDSEPDEIARMVAAYEFVKGYMKWDEYTGLFAGSTLRSAFNDRSGSIADINLMLILLMQKVGFDVTPVILSTRSNGIVNPFFPSSTQFNYVIAQVKIGKNTYLLDASDPLMMAGMLPERCLNGTGRTVVEGAGDWVDLNTGHIYEYNTELNLKMDESGEFNGTLKNRREGYAAHRLRRMVEEEKSEEELVKKIESSNAGLTIESHDYISIDSIYNPVEEIYNILISGKSDVAGDIIYLNPMFFEQIKSNPFKLQERKYPIDYSYPRNEVYTLTLEIPEGYVFDETPRPVKLALPEGKGLFEYSVKCEGNKLVLTNKFIIKQTVFLNDEYQLLRDFYNKMVEKHAEIVVIKKSI